MRRIAGVGTAVTAALAVCAVMAATAFAGVPEFLGEGGKSATGTTFTATHGTTVLQPKELAESAIECLGGTAEGTITGVKTTGKVTVKLTGCKEKTSKHECKSPGAAKEEIVTKPLVGVIGPVEGGSGVGEQLEPESEVEEYMVTECATTTKVTGSLIGELKKTKELSNKNELVYKDTAGKQAITTFLGAGESDFLTDGSLGQAGIEETEAITFSKALEITSGESATEEQKISIAPIKKAIPGQECPEAAGRVVFETLNELCEYRVENKNAAEPVYIEKVEIGQEVQCVGILNNCLTSVGTENTPKCKPSFRKTRLGPGGVCYVQLEYTKKPATLPSVASLSVETKSTPGNLKKEVTAGQNLK